MPAAAEATSRAEGLRCLRCGSGWPLRPDAYLCPDCGIGALGEDPGILDVLYDHAGLHARFPAAARSMDSGRGSSPGIFRWAELLPTGPPSFPSLPAGATPLVPAPRLARALGLGALYLKDETRNPTRCLKDRATAVAVSLAAALGRRTLYCASAGNAAVSLAGFCAHAGLECHAYVPAAASQTRIAWLRRYGATVHAVEGGYDDAVDRAEAEGPARGWYSRNCALNPFLVEGKKTAAFEIAEQLGWRAPDLVAAPVGDGCTLGALGKGFREIAGIGRVSEIPRLIGVQAAAVQPLVRRFHCETVVNGTLGSASGMPPTVSATVSKGAAESSETVATSIAVRRPRNALRLLAEVRASGGVLLAAEDAAIAAAARRLAAEAGMVAELSAAAGLAGLAALAQAESLDGKVAVVVVTGGRVDAEGDDREGIDPVERTQAAGPAGTAGGTRP